MKPSRHITVACPHCEKRHKVLPKQVGITANCKRCGERFEVKPKQALAEPDRPASAPRTADGKPAKEYFIPISLTSSPMIDNEYNRDSRAQTQFTNFQKHPDKGNSAWRSFIVFACVLLVLALASFLAYWFLIPK
jgi:DNA-directed RNA polymerase subunit RPC12/RpoP